ncbi:hypothetical protein Calow_0011 [Caldicellulosiruptor owensensis OL]|uniref:Uncharacterized protein n=1 Tax=Caldicellulosiruptor owensensis (strain ATCC 700167 / DSM 13100 / OL) TaxID=632518 RepID=E4Q1T2_CALOW|nr:hypothetical protein [Caldicellulosiruptor owensensis]ADQ03631.1 hypothetical protein Calow_0011 [Caldicellulosiruptor owensensis OL]
MIINSLNTYSGLNVDYRIYSEAEKAGGENLAIFSLSRKDTEKNSIAKQQKEFNDPKIRFLKRIGILECKTCKDRKYQDVSNDPGVSFKTPSHISPEFSASAVLAHEREHVTRETQNAKEKGKEVVSSSISLTLSVCPECGRVYVSGGKTKVVTKSTYKDPFIENYNRNIIENFGFFVDTVI